MSVPFTDDIAIVKPTPALEYYGEEATGIYHEDRELNGAMYRVSNAYYNETSELWTIQNDSFNAYGIVENADGSINYLFWPKTGSPWQEWQGQGQPQVYNTINYGMSPDAADNTGALQAALNAAFGNGGGVVFIPAGTYQIAGPITLAGGGNDPGIIIVGASGGTTLVHTASGDFFTFNDFTTGNGVRFRDLTIAYSTTAASGHAIIVANCQNITCERLTFFNCPSAMTDDGGSAQCGLYDCFINFQNGQSTQAMVYLAGTQDFVESCVLQQGAIGAEALNDTAGVGIKLAGHTSYVSNTSITDFSTGITIVGPATDLYFDNVSVVAYTYAVLIQQGGGDTLYGVYFSSCTFTLASGSPNQTSGVLITANTPSYLASIFIKNCTSFGWANAGIEIDAGQNIVISGGQYSSNGQNPSNTDLGAGVAIMGASAASDIIINGADCSGVYELWEGRSSPPPPTQPIGISVGGGSGISIVGCNVSGNASNGVHIAGPIGPSVQNVFIRSCDATSYPEFYDAISVNGQPGEVAGIEVTNCAGYNDSGNLITNSLPPSGFSAVSYGYFGPAAFYATGATNVTVKFVNPSGSQYTVPIENGTFPLGIGWSVDYTVGHGGTAWTNFVMLGQ